MCLLADLRVLCVRTGRFSLVLTWVGGSQEPGAGAGHQLGVHRLRGGAAHPW
jgi:hypothetical protein